MACLNHQSTGFNAMEIAKRILFCRTFCTASCWMNSNVSMYRAEKFYCDTLYGLCYSLQIMSLESTIIILKNIYFSLLPYQINSTFIFVVSFSCFSFIVSFVVCFFLKDIYDPFLKNPYLVFYTIVTSLCKYYYYDYFLLIKVLT